ncbi:hypothetical protein [Streptomyces sp. R35]|uniref:Secreted protein n=1 Tax=Streptomyces sp. R35 TaxID=3238630 RepID=A0AB39SIG8_9ACTN
MRRTARALFATALAGAALGAAASAAFADPAAEVSPGSVEPGGTLTISVTCDAIGGAPPDFIDATSQGFEEGKVQLSRVQGDTESAAGAAYRGTARIPSGGNFDGGSDATGPEPEWGVDGACPEPPGGQKKPWKASYTVARGTKAASGTAQWPPDVQGPPDVQRPPAVQRGVHAGEGGAFTGSVPALVAGSVLIAGALGAAVHRLRHKDTSADS